MSTVNATIASPRVLVVGGGTVGQIADLLRKFGLLRPLVVSDPVMVATGLIQRVLEPLARAGIAVTVFSDTVSDPTDSVIEAGVAALHRGKFDCLVGFGGGSPIDTAKAMAILAAGGGKMRDYKAPVAADTGALPIIAVPTTAGTGSECTRFTVVTDTEHDEKMLIAGLGALPLAAIVDYELTYTVPARTTADTGVDSLTHALEAFVSKRANPFSDALALSAMALIGKHIRTAFAEPRNAAAREGMMLGATQAGLAFSNSSVALVHGMSRPIGAHFHVPHGLSNAMLLPAITRYSVPGAEARYAEAARCIGFAEAGDADGVAAAKLLTGLEALNKALSVPSPADYGIREADWNNKMELMAQQALASGSPANNPRVPEAAEIVALYREVWTGAAANA
ncbi:MAG TPA: iron-containing alcohol dehydrogenase [Acetobacteraceae bacterium]|jgi:alcohol dehydrogenase class IV|nr:iron-containing alcohol dehydrogenase [Acetobacteraceae bacterium]